MLLKWLMEAVQPPGSRTCISNCWFLVRARSTAIATSATTYSRSESSASASCTTLAGRKAVMWLLAREIQSTMGRNAMGGTSKLLLIFSSTCIMYERLSEPTSTVSKNITKHLAYRAKLCSSCSSS